MLLREAKEFRFRGPWHQRCDSGIGCLLHARLQDNLDAAVLLVTECLVQLRPLLKRGRMSDYERGIDALLDALKQLRQVVLHRSLRHAEG